MKYILVLAVAEPTLLVEIFVVLLFSFRLEDSGINLLLRHGENVPFGVGTLWS